MKAIGSCSARGLWLGVAAALIAVSASAQVAPLPPPQLVQTDVVTIEVDTVIAFVPPWEVDVVGRLSGSQTGFHNWAEGGAGSFSSSASINSNAMRTSDSWREAHESRLAFGIIRQSGTDMRKAEDVLRFNSSLSYRGNGVFRTLSPTLAFGLRTQFAPGYNYERNPFNDEREPPVKVSDFLSPATFQQSIGLSYSHSEWFSQRLGIGSKQTIVVIERLRPLHGVNMRKLARFQMGVESKTDVAGEIAKNVHVKSSLALFAAFNQPDLPDMQWENLITMKVNSWLGVNFELVAFYDRDVSAAVQLKEVLSVGVTVVIV